jgi:hypothetical protein
VSGKLSRRILWLALGALAAAQLYLVRELLAALVLFAILFAALGVPVLILFLLQKAGEKAIAWAEHRWRTLAGSLRPAAPAAQRIHRS